MTRLSEDKCLKRLKKYSDYNENSYGININYELNSTELINLCERINLKQFGIKESFHTMCDIMHYVYERLYCPDIRAKTTRLTRFSANTVLDMIERKKIRLSCWVYSQVLTECFLALGIPARMVRCLSGLLFDNDCHCVTVAYCDEYKKYVLFDVANNTIYYSYKGYPLSLGEFREHILSDNRILVIQAKPGNKQGLIKYWIKNLMIFQNFEIQQYGNELNISNNRSIYLYPAKLRIQKMTIPINTNYQPVFVRNSEEFWRLP